MGVRVKGSGSMRPSGSSGQGLFTNQETYFNILTVSHSHVCW